jgi:hypothetical protein
MGRWRGETFLEYVREGMAEYTVGMAEQMAKQFAFVSLEGGVFSDVTMSVLEEDYNLNVSGIGWRWCRGSTDGEGERSGELGGRVEGAPRGREIGVESWMAHRAERAKVEKRCLKALIMTAR